MEYPAFFLFVAVTLHTSSNVGQAISVSVTRYVSSMNEETDGEVIVGYYSYSTASGESSVSCSMTSSDNSLVVLQGTNIVKRSCSAWMDYDSFPSYTIKVTCTAETSSLKTTYISVMVPHAAIDGYIVKRSCTACMNYDSFPSYTVTVTCTADQTSWWFTTTTSHSGSMTFSIVKSSPPYFTSSPYSVTVDGFSVSAGQAVYDLNWADPDSSSLTVTYVPAAGSHVFGNTLWNFDKWTGMITAAKTMREEFTYTYYLTVTVADRRNTVSQTVTIYLNACHITPNCTDQSSSIPDTFPMGGTLFTQSVPNSDLFTGLSYSMSTTLSQASINSVTGTITTTGNITVHPYYPSRTWTISVTVSASGSCYTYTCTHSLTVTFTNWPIFITSLPASTTVHEDTDSRILIHSLITWDNNYDSQDNVTCHISSDPLTGSCVGTLFDLVHDGNHNYNSYSLYKKSCDSPGCGVICDTNGCLDHDVTTSYEIGITCNDGYGSSDTSTFTMYVRQNDPPVLTNLDNTITLNTDVIAKGDVLFTIYYTDTENENLNYNYTYNGVVFSNLFSGDTFGNYHNNAANITAVADQWDLSNATYTVYICGSERRNTRCGTLTIHIRDYCGNAPLCDSDMTTVSDRFGIGNTLFTINVPNQASLSGTQSYTVFSEYTYFTVSSSGVIKTTASLTATYPSTRYYINARVYDTAACDFAFCQFQVDVAFTNDLINITNLGSGVAISIHEDIIMETTLYTIQTSDATIDDSVTCNVTSTSPSTTAFETRETYPGSDVYLIISKAYPGFDYDTCNQYSVTVECWDSYGSTDNDYLTVNIEENQAPVFANLNSSTIINVDPATTFAGTSIFTVTTTDAENDNLFYNYTIYNQRTPFDMSATAVVILHRNISIHEEDGAIYWIHICVYDPHNEVCGNLSVTFTSSKRRPIINNLPDSISVPENTTSGSSIFTLSVTDPDGGDIHSYTMTVTPASYTSTFSLNSLSGVLSLASGQKLDYETLTFYQITFSVRDQYLVTNETKVLSITITDVNESPFFTATLPDLIIGEGKAGTVVGTPSIKCSDPDSADTLAFSISGPHQAYFNMNSTTGKLTLAQDWDLESGQGTSTYLTVYCVDSSGLQASTNLNVNITPVNEFAPVLSVNTVEINVTDQTLTTDILLNITATDQDFGDDSVFHFYILGFGFGTQYYIINGNGNIGQLSLSQQIRLDYTFNATFTVIVSDNDTSPLDSSVTVKIYYTPTPPKPKTPPSYCTLCTTEGVAVVSILAVESLVVVAIVFYVGIKYAKPIYTIKPTTKSINKPQSLHAPKKEKEKEVDRMSVKSTDSYDSVSSVSSEESSDSDD